MKTFFKAFCSAVAASLTLTAPADEFRGMWVDAWGTGFLTPSQVTTLVSQCRTYNFNAVIVQMRRRGDSFYFPQAPNEEPRTTAISSTYDALQDIITKCHTGSPRIEVHCWVPTHLIWSDPANPPPQPGHVYNLHPEYLMKNSSGATQIGSDFFIDPGHPEVPIWNYNMAMDIVSRYDIDGFHWDYIRYPTTDSGYNDTAIVRYNVEFGLSGQPAYTDAQFSTWRRRQVTDFLRWANADLLAIKPNLIISAAVFASRSDAYNARFQDWAAWNNEGIIDICLPMNYTSNNSTYNSRVDDCYNNQGVRWVYMGQGAYLNTKANTVTQLLYARNKPLNGTSCYSYRVPNSGTIDRIGTFTYVRDNFQPAWEYPPALPWKTAPTAGIVKGTITRQDTGEVLYNATVTVNTSPEKTQLSEVHGKYAHFEVPEGGYTVTASAPGFDTAQAGVFVSAGSVATIDLALAESAAPTEFIIDNPSASVAGAWSTGTGATDKYGANYRYKSQGTGAAYLQYTPTIVTGGYYDVYEWHTQGSNRSAGTPHEITDYTGSPTTIYVDQRVNGGQWNYLTTLWFEPGTGGNVRITDGFSDAGQIALADAIKFVYVQPPSPPADPTDLAAYGAWYDQIDLYWTDNATNEDYYVVYRAEASGGPYTEVAWLPADTTWFSDTGLASGTMYCYIIYAYNWGGWSNASNEASSTTW